MTNNMPGDLRQDGVLVRDQRQGEDQGRLGKTANKQNTIKQLINN